MSTVGEDYDLSGDDVSIVVEILTPVSFKWEEIAIALNLPVVAKMQCRNPMHIIALTNVLNAWWSIKDKKHTLGQLRKAIAGPIVGHGRLAGKLISEFNKAKESIEEPLTSDSEVLNTAAAKGLLETWEYFKSLRIIQECTFCFFSIICSVNACRGGRV